MFRIANRVRSGAGMEKPKEIQEIWFERVDNCGFFQIQIKIVWNHSLAVVQEYKVNKINTIDKYDFLPPFFHSSQAGDFPSLLRPSWIFSKMKRRVTLGSDGTEGNWVLMIGVKVGRSFPFEGRRLELHLPPSLTLPLPTHLQLPVSSAFQILPDILINKNSYLFLLLTPQLPHILFPQLPLLPLLAQRRVAETVVLLAVGFLAGAEYCPSEPTLPRVLAHEIVHVFARACSNLCQHAFLSLSSFVRTHSICSAPILLILFDFYVFPAFGTPEVTILLLEALGAALPFQANLSRSQCANAMHSSAFFLIDASAVMGYSVFLPNFLTFLIGLLGLNDAGRVGGEMRQMG